MIVRSYEKEDLLAVLRLCAHQLLLAFDETKNDSLWHASEEAAKACQFLLFSITKTNDNMSIH